VTTGAPLVSVVTPTNRGGPWMQEALRSALTQSMDDLEVIVVDDDTPGGLPQKKKKRTN
jgi:glycosyltransferase involved in cell wall biosynthesis